MAMLLARGGLLMMAVSSVALLCSLFGGRVALVAMVFAAFLTPGAMLVAAGAIVQSLDRTRQSANIRFRTTHMLLDQPQLTLRRFSDEAEASFSEREEPSEQ